jgi:hypothetical protein
VSTVLSNQFGDIVTANGTSFLGLSWQVWLLFWQAFPRKQIKKSEQLFNPRIGTAPTAQYGYGIPDFSSFNSVKDLDKNYFVVYPNPT